MNPNMEGTNRKMSQRYFFPAEYALSQSLKLTLTPTSSPGPSALLTRRALGTRLLYPNPNPNLPLALGLGLGLGFLVSFRFCLSGVLR